MVPLKRYSDVVFLAWQHRAGESVKDLKYIVSIHIENPDTLQVIQEIFAR
jgi:hypothetical protein